MRIGGGEGGWEIGKKGVRVGGGEGGWEIGKKGVRVGGRCEVWQLMSSLMSSLNMVYIITVTLVSVILHVLGGGLYKQ